MKVRKWLSISLVLLLLLALAGCGAASTDSVEMNEAYDQVVAETYAEAPMDNKSLSTQDTTTNISTERKWIITINMRAETEDLDVLLAGLNDKIEALDGYVESRQVYNGSAYSSSRRYRSASLTVRIPAESVDQFTEHMAGVSNVVSNNQELKDVTLTYVSVESRMKALQAEEERLLELMGQAETMSDLLEIESRLTQVRYELESVTSQLRVYDNQVDYATIYLDISEVTEYTVVEEQTVWQRIGSGFVASLKGVGNFFVEVFVFLIANLPYLVLIGVIVWLIVWLCRRGKKRRAAKRAAYNPPPYYPPAPDQNRPE